MQPTEMASESELLAYYIARFYTHLMTPDERAAHMRLTVASSPTTRALRSSTEALGGHPHRECARP